MVKQTSTGSPCILVHRVPCPMHYLSIRNKTKGPEFENKRKKDNEPCHFMSSNSFFPPTLVPKPAGSKTLLFYINECPRYNTTSQFKHLKTFWGYARRVSSRHTGHVGLVCNESAIINVHQLVPQCHFPWIISSFKTTTNQFQSDCSRHS